MLNIFRRHGTTCKNSGRSKPSGLNNKDCPSHPHCPIYVEGMDGSGRIYKTQRLIDPETGQVVRDWPRALKILEWMMRPTSEREPEHATIHQAICEFLKTLSHASVDRQKRFERLLRRMESYLSETHHRAFLKDIKPTDLSNWVSTWTGTSSTRRVARENLRQFFSWCVAVELLTRNPALALKPIADEHIARDPFTAEELERVFAALPEFPDEYGRKGGPIAAQVEAFVLVMRYTGLDVSTVMNLRKADVDFENGRIHTHRAKTQRDLVSIPVPKVVLDKLASCPHDSEERFFWSGQGQAHTRATKWFSRLRKLLDLAGCQHRTAHNFRHSFAATMLQAGVPIYEVGKMLGHSSSKVTERHYAKWSKTLQDNLDSHVMRVFGSTLYERQQPEVPVSVK